MKAKNEQSRDTNNIRHKIQNEDKLNIKHNTEKLRHEPHTDPNQNKNKR
jgi:hypothetical protein